MIIVGIWGLGKITTHFYCDEKGRLQCKMVADVVAYSLVQLMITI